MPHPARQIATGLAYGLSQLPRFAWYMGHGAIMRELSKRAQRRAGEGARTARTNRPVPDQWRLYADMAQLFRQDLANVARGIYPLPADHDGALPTLIDRSRLFFEDLPQEHRRRERR